MHTLTDFVVLLRGINVGGKNKISMTDLKRHLTVLGCENVITYIQSGNVLLRSDLDAEALGVKIERMLFEECTLDSPSIKALVLSKGHLQNIINNKPKGFGEKPEQYLSDVIFLIGDIDGAQALLVFKPRDGVDQVWLGNKVIYSRRLSELRTRSRLSAIISTPEYKFMTIRNWNTVTKLLSLMV